MMVLVNIRNRGVTAFPFQFSCHNSVLNPGNNLLVSDFHSNGCACEKIEGFVQRNQKDNDGPDNDFLEQDNNGSYHTHSSIGLEMTSKITGA